jgi:MFS family permease
VYVADVNIAQYGMSLNQAVVAGGFFALVAYSVLGRAVGCPLAGKLTDILARRGVSRTVVLVGWLALAIALLLFLSTGVTAFWPLVAVTVMLGMTVNLFALVPAAISETYGPQRTSSVASFANMLGQFSGATALAVSGYVGISLNTQPGNALTEYRGIWLAGLAGMAIMSGLGAATYVAIRAGWARRPALYLPVPTPGV